MKTILKFDSGASGFKKAIYVLALTAVLVLLLGISFILFVFKPLTEKTY